MNWTTEQFQVITLRDRNILVSAAAGSGKTAVLVERIIGRILDQNHPLDIDRMLIVTFTSAAAAEMRERISAAIESALEQNPADSHLQKQASLVHHAQITTIHSFCLNLIRNYFHRVDLEPNFRIAEEGELNLLREDVMAEVLNQNYETADEVFLQCVECFAFGKTDDKLKEMILKLYHFAMSDPWPKEWLKKASKEYCFETFEDLEKKPWMQSLMEYLNYVSLNLYQMAERNAALSSEEDGPLYLKETMERDALQLKHFAEAKDYRSMSQAFSFLNFDRLPSKRGYEGSLEKLEYIKGKRDEIKTAVKKMKTDFFFAEENEHMERLSRMAPVITELMRLTGEFIDAFDKKKREKNILDFDDLEHFALKILLNEETKEPTEAALSFRQLYEEVMIDEYQDSNLVQESLMRAVSREDMGRFNRFMVGDVKQSIYRFRLARPELFMEKYDSYTTKESDCQKIELHKNFRSRTQVLDFTNHIFYQIMRKDLGNVEYDDAQALYAGAVYPEDTSMQAEVILADSGEELLEDAGLTDPVRYEAEIVSSRIRKMMREQKVTDKQTGKLRDIRYSDIVILLRSFGKYADTFLEVLEQKKIPAHATSKTGYFKALEIQTILSLLKILDNPRQDIPLAAVLRSPIGGFSDEELALIKISNQKKSFHCCVLDPQADKLPEELFIKLENFLKKLSEYRDLVPRLPIHELLYYLLEDTGYARYAAAMQNGSRRKANIEMLLEKAVSYEKTSYRGLFHFIRYIDKLQKYEVDYGEADVINENANAVRIMTIHKSKGLEFSVVFLCGTDKSFNKMDTKSRLILHPDFGAAVDDIDPNLRIRRTTLFKKAAAKQLELENLGEELRVLYVALTRAKEKLIITGVTKKLYEKLENFTKQESKFSYYMRTKANSFLDWILPAVIFGGDKNLIQIWTPADLIEEETEHQLKEAEGLNALFLDLNRKDEKADAYVSRQLTYRYPDMIETTRKTKYSVSELKHHAMQSFYEEQDVLEEVMPSIQIVPYIPHFAGGETKVYKGALTGNAMHRAIECLPMEYLAGSKDIENLLETSLQTLAETNRLDEEAFQLLQKEKLIHFYRSPLAVRMKQAALKKELYLEQPFVMGRPADEIEHDGSSTMLLVQGIIDAFFIEEGQIVLVDYKTDKVQTEQELIDRYQTQLDLYQQALEHNLSKKVKQKIIYSFCLEKEILLK